MKNKLLITVVFCLSAVLCGCGSQTPAEGDNSAQSASSVSSSQNESASSSSDDTDDENSENYINPERKNTDYDDLSKRSTALISRYYDGINKGDYSCWEDLFPDFYLEALAEEGKAYNQTNEEFVASINADCKLKYGDDFYAYGEEPAILQLTDKSVAELKTAIKETFGVDADLRDAYSVNYNAVERGSVDRQNFAMEYFMLDIGGKDYLYDQYFTEMKIAAAASAAAAGQN